MEKLTQWDLTAWLESVVVEGYVIKRKPKACEGTSINIQPCGIHKLQCRRCGFQ